MAELEGSDENVALGLSEEMEPDVLAAPGGPVDPKRKNGGLGLTLALVLKL